MGGCDWVRCEKSEICDNGECKPCSTQICQATFGNGWTCASNYVGCHFACPTTPPPGSKSCDEACKNEWCRKAGFEACHNGMSCANHNSKTKGVR